MGFKCGITKVIVGPCNDRDDAVKLGNNQSITQEEAQALEDISKAGYQVNFPYLPDVSIAAGTNIKANSAFKKNLLL